MSTSFTNLADFSPDDLAVPPKQRMAADEYVTWVLREEASAELVENRVVMMLPRSRDHVEACLWLISFLGMYCDVSGDGQIGMSTLMRIGHGHFRIPDIFFIAKGREQIIGHTMLREPPDMAIEIVSPDSSARDWREKYFEYESSVFASTG